VKEDGRWFWKTLCARHLGCLVWISKTDFSEEVEGSILSSSISVRATFSSSMDPEQWFKGSVLWLRADSCPMSVIVGYIQQIIWNLATKS
jgi:hypothetical protein